MAENDPRGDTIIPKTPESERLLTAVTQRMPLNMTIIEVVALADAIRRFTEQALRDDRARRDWSCCDDPSCHGVINRRVNRERDGG